MNGTQAIEDRYDAVVVGARVAGAATAMLLARAGLRVLAVDRSRYGSDTLSTHALMRAGVLQLHRWGVLDRVVAAGTPATRTTSFHYADEAIEIPIKPRDGVDALYSPRRTVLDALLVDAALEAGARVVHGPRMVDLLRAGDGRVRGVVLEDPAGNLRRVDASIVIGADGLRSHMARRVGAEIYREGQYATGNLYGYWSGLGIPGNQWYYRPGISTGAIPTNDGLTCVFVSVPDHRLRNELGGDVEGSYRRLLAEVSPELSARTADGRLEGKLHMFPGHKGFLRRCHGPGWALVGDAAYFKDPLTAHGITDALRDAELLARAILRGADGALVDYQTARDELALELFDVTDEIASFDWTLDEVKQMHLALSKQMNREAEALAALDTGGTSIPLSRSA